MRLLLIVMVLMMWSCNSKSKGPDVSSIKVDVQIQRFDKDLFDTTKPIMQKMESMLSKYGIVFENYLVRTGIAAGLATGLKPEIIFGRFVTDNRALYDSVQLQYKSMVETEKEFKQAFQYYKHYFPKANTPKIFTYVDAFYQDVDEASINGVEYIKDTLIIDLQMFLGKGFSYYNPEVYFDYLQERFNKKYIVRNSLIEMIKANYAPLHSDAQLVEHMIDQGKRLFVLEKLLPNVDKHIIIGYDKTKYATTVENETNVWTFFVNNNYLFSTDPQNHRDFNKDGPKTKELGEGTPGNIGAFVGWQIVKSYMAKNKALTMQQLLDADPKKIYQEAKYKP